MIKHTPCDEFFDKQAPYILCYWGSVTLVQSLPKMLEESTRFDPRVYERNSGLFWDFSLVCNKPLLLLILLSFRFKGRRHHDGGSRGKGGDGSQDTAASG